MDENICCFVTGLIETNCWLYAPENNSVRGGKRDCAVIDPGDEGEAIVFRLKELNWTPRWVLLTHGHFDHLAGLPDFLAACKKEGVCSGVLPTVGIHRLDAAYLGKSAVPFHLKSIAAAGGDPAWIAGKLNALPDADILFEDGGKAGPFTVLHIPGHSPGSAGFYDENSGVLFSGDTLFRGNCGRTDLPGGNSAEMSRSLRRLLSMDRDTRVFPGHGEATTIAEEKTGWDLF